MKTPRAPEALFVGERNERTGRPALALWPWPACLSGGRLCKFLGLPPDEFLRRFARLNLCSSRWSPHEARRTAADIAAVRPVVLLGSRVAFVFGFPYHPFEIVAPGVLVLPHPSGRCRTWNDSAAAARARTAFQALLAGKERAS